MKNQDAPILTYLLFGSFFMGIFTLQVFFFLMLLYNLYGLIRKRHWPITRSWLRHNRMAMGLFFMMLFCAIWQQVFGIPGKFGFHWGLFGVFLLTHEQIGRIRFEVLHRVLLVASLPGLIYSVYWLLQPDELAWAFKVGFHMYPRAAGFLSNPITHAEGLGILLAWSLARLASDLSPQERRWIIAHILFSLLILLFSRTRSGLLGFAALMAIHGLFSPKHRKLCIVILGLFLAGLGLTLAIFGFNWASIHERIELYSHTYDLFRQHPWLGIGPDRFKLYPFEANPDLFAHPHNTMMGILTEMGVIGFAVYLTFMAAVAMQTWKVFQGENARGAQPNWVRRAMVYTLFAWWFFGIFDFNFHDNELLIMHAFHWCILARLTEPISNTDKQTTIQT